MKKPSVDLGLCTQCMGCIELCPAVFRQNEAAGYIEVIELNQYPVANVDEAIKYCPEDAITWEDI